MSRERVVNVHFLLGAVGSNADDSPRVEPVWQKVPLTVCQCYTSTTKSPFLMLESLELPTKSPGKSP